MKTAEGMNPAAGQGTPGYRQAAHYQPLVVVLLAYCAGLCFDRWADIDHAWWILGAVTALAMWLFAWRRGATLLPGICVLLAVVMTAAAWHHTRYRTYRDDDLGRFARLTAAPVCLQVRATAAPQLVPASHASPLRSAPAHDRTQLLVEIEAIRDRDRWRTASGQATLTVEGHLLGITPGDRLQVFARLSRPPPAGNPGEFDFADYLRRERQTSLLFAAYPDCITRQEAADSWRPMEWIARIRDRGEQLLFQNIDRPQAGLASAVLLGERSGIARDTNEAFVQTGTVHLLAISGLHIGILAGSLMLILRTGWLPQRPVLIAVMALTVSYALLADARPSVVRATVLIVIFCLSIYLGRPALRFNTLAAAGLVLLIFQPLELFSVGTQLSFLAVATLIAAAPSFRRWQHQDALDRVIEETRTRPIRYLRWGGRWYWRLTLAGLAIWLVALPLLMYRMHLVSPAGAVFTPLLYLPLAITLISGLGILIFGSFAPPLAAVLGDFCGAAIATIDQAVHWIRELPGSYFWVAGPELWWMAIFYLSLVAWALLPRWRPPRRWCVALLALWIAIGVSWPLLSKPRDQLRCTFIDVAHGCSVALELPDDRVLLYDAGRLASPRGAARSIAAYLWSRGRTHIDAIVISHADVDHYNAVPDLLEQFSVGVVFVSPVMLEDAQRPDANRAVRELFRVIEQAEVPVKTLHGGQHLASGEVQIDLLHPPAAGVLALERRQVDNANSLVMAIEYAGRRILLPGDLESPGAEYLMAEQPWDCDVLLAPHHGSPRSNPPGFAAWCRPEWTVVSGRRGSNLAAVKAAYGPPGSPSGRVLHTAQTGAISVTVDGSESARLNDSPGRNRLQSEATGNEDVNRGTLTVDWHRDGLRP